MELRFKDKHVGATLLDFFNVATPRHRSLWNPSLVLTLKEVLEASEAFRASARGKESLKDLLNHAVRFAGADPGTGEPKQRQLLQQALSTFVSHDGLDFLTVAGIAQDVETQVRDGHPRWQIRPRGLGRSEPHVPSLPIYSTLDSARTSCIDGGPTASATNPTHVLWPMCCGMPTTSHRARYALSRF